MDWRMQVLRQPVFARVPFGSTLWRLKRRQSGCEPDSVKVHGTVSNLEQMTAIAVGCSFDDVTVFEIGSGWQT